MSQKITPYLWFDNNVEEAVDFYPTVFKDAEIMSVSRQGEGGPVMSASFRLNGQEFVAFSGGPMFKFNEAISFMIQCETQEEVDHYWDRLTDGGEEGQCGWLKDRFGLSWQVTPVALGEMLQDEDPAKANRVMQAMLQMKKIDIATLQEAYAQEE